MSSTLPLEYDAWKAAWRAWIGAHPELRPARSPFRGKNFLAVEILGTFKLGSETIEFSAVIFPNLSERDERGNLMHYDRRLIGITSTDDAHTTTVESFDELEQVLGIGG